MAFTVETGAALQDANSYVSLAFADDYHVDRGHPSWALLSDSDKQHCLIRATDYVDKRFGRKFRGSKTTREQALQWPRFDVYDNSGFLLIGIDQIPRNLQKAIAEYALRASLVGELAPDPIPVVPRQDLGVDVPVVPTEYAGGMVSRISEKADVIEETKSFMTPVTMASAGKNKTPISGLVTDSLIPEYPAADMLLEELIRNRQRNLVRG